MEERETKIPGANQPPESESTETRNRIGRYLSPNIYRPRLIGRP